MKGIFKRVAAAVATAAVMFGGMGAVKAEMYPNDGQSCDAFEEIFSYVPAQYEYGLCTMAPISSVIEQSEYSHPDYHERMMMGIELAAERDQCWAAAREFDMAADLAEGHELYEMEAKRGHLAAAACIDMKENGTISAYEAFRSPYGAWVSISGERSSMD